jgi:hypothetical protein
MNKPRMKTHTKWEVAALMVIAAMASITGESLPLESGQETPTTEVISERDEVPEETSTLSAAASGIANQSMLRTETIFPAADTSGIVHVSATGMISPVAAVWRPLHVSATGTVSPAADASETIHVVATGTVSPARDGSGAVYVSATGTVSPAPDGSGAVHVSATGTVSPAADASSEASAPEDSSSQQVLVRMERHAVQPDPESVDDEEQISDTLDRISEPNKEKQ